MMMIGPKDVGVKILYKAKLQEEIDYLMRNSPQNVLTLFKHFGSKNTQSPKAELFL